jgi:phosphoadenosine phosphosulfate reductase
MLTPEEIERLSKEFETYTPQKILSWAIDQFWPQIAMSCSFQTQSMPLLHMATQIRHNLLILFLDTGYHFWETLIFREQIASQWKLNMLDLYRDTRWDNFARQHIRSLPLEDPNLCCYLNKVQPMQKALVDLNVWITGIRRDQTATRAHAKILELQPDNLLKVNPLLNWTRADVDDYIKEHDLPVHPLLAKGYRSIGCAPCTVAIGLGENVRAGRWVGRSKTECGLHTEMFAHKDFSEFNRNIHFDPSEEEDESGSGAESKGLYKRAKFPPGLDQPEKKVVLREPSTVEDAQAVGS